MLPFFVFLRRRDEKKKHERGLLFVVCITFEEEGGDNVHASLFLIS